MWSSRRIEGFLDSYASATGDIGSITGDSSSAGESSASLSFGQPSAGQPSSSISFGQPSAGESSASTSFGQPSAGQPSAGQPSADQPSTGQPSTGQPSTGQPSTGQPSASGTSLTFLQNLIYRIDQESLSLNKLPNSSTDVTTMAKINQLGLLSAQLQEYIDKLKANPPTITLADIPLTASSADAFLATLGKPASTTSEYPSLFTTTSSLAPTTGASAASGPSTSLGSLGKFDFSSLEGVIDLFKNLQDIKWRFELSNDPMLSQKTDLINRLESLEKRIMVYAKEGVAMPDSVKQVLTQELNILTSLINNTKQQESDVKYLPRQGTQYTRNTSATTYRQSDGRTYSNPQMTSHSGSYSLFDGVPQDSPDVRIRPGFVLTDEQIRRRGSAAAFNTQAVGGADYKKRSEDLCRQIRNANIGTATDFGCIENSGEVSANYSWKGNYTMVCNRLGDTWGSWYPEMFGCPKQDPDDRYNGNLL